MIHEAASFAVVCFRRRQLVQWLGVLVPFWYRFILHFFIFLSNHQGLSVSLALLLIVIPLFLQDPASMRLILIKGFQLALNLQIDIFFFDFLAFEILNHFEEILLGLSNCLKIFGIFLLHKSFRWSFIEIWWSFANILMKLKAILLKFSIAFAARLQISWFNLLHLLFAWEIINLLFCLNSFLLFFWLLIFARWLFDDWVHRFFLQSIESNGLRRLYGLFSCIYWL